MKLGRFTETRKSIIEKLSAREMEVLLALAQGETRKSISEKFSISVLTYDEHRKNIKMKLRLGSPADWASALVLFRNVSTDEITNKNK